MQAQKANLAAALSCSLILEGAKKLTLKHPSSRDLLQVNEEELFLQIVGLSYLGDIRMVSSFSENPNKVGVEEVFLFRGNLSANDRF